MEDLPDGSGMRIVSLIASATEIVCALGLGDKLVGRSHECDFPPAVERLPVCTQPKFNVQAPSLGIDRQVKELLEQALSVYRVESEVLKALRPTHILTQTQCEVCAVSLKDVERAVGDLLNPAPQIVALQPNGLADVWEDMLRVASALEAAEQGRQLLAQLRSRMEAVAQTARALPQRPSVACIEWIDPLMASGNWMPELVEMAGGRNQFGLSGRHAPYLRWEDLVEADPDVILLLPCGFSIARTRRELTPLTRRAEWPRLRAVREGRVFLLDGNQYFNRPGPRLAESLEILAEILHPREFHFGHEGPGWQRL